MEAKSISARAPAFEVLADAIDALAGAVYLTDSDGGLLYVNGSGAAMLERRDILYRCNGALRACDATADRMLREIFKNGVAHPAAIALTAQNGRRGVAHAFPFRPGRNGLACQMAVATALFVHAETPCRREVVDAIARHFGLTGSEAKVFTAVTATGGTTNVAPRLGISSSTVKTHLKRVYGKTGAHSQADLVRLLMEWTNPMI